MSCRLCESSNEAELATEMVIHFPGLKKSRQTRSLGILEAFGLLGLRRLPLKDS